MYKVFCKIGVFVFFHVPIVSHKKTRPRIGHKVLHHRRVASVDVLLHRFPHIDVSKSCRRTLHAEARVKHKRIKPVVIVASLGQVRLVFRGKKHGVTRKFDIVQLAVFLVVPIDHRRLLRGVHRVVVKIFGRGELALSRQQRKLRVCLPERVVVHQRNIKHLTRVLYVVDARLPV